MRDNSASTSPPRPINRYGTMAWDHWERHRAQTLKSIDDPTTFFRDLGRLIEAEIETELRTRSTAASPRPTPRKASQLRDEIEEQVLTHHLWTEPSRLTSPSRSNLDPDLIDEIAIPTDAPMLSAWRDSPLIHPTT